LSPLDSNPRELIAFAGAVQCEVAAGAVDLVLRGYERARPPARSEVAELLFSGAGAVALPPELHDARVIELTRAPAPRRYRIESPQLQLELSARSAQLHRDVAAAFFAAVPPARVPLRQRLGWSLLLTLLRLPRAELLVRKLRGST
jgi:hypothetical protein